MEKGSHPDNKYFYMFDRDLFNMTDLKNSIREPEMLKTLYRVWIYNWIFQLKSTLLLLYKYNESVHIVEVFEVYFAENFLIAANISSKITQFKTIILITETF